MSGTTVRKLRRISDGASDTSYYLMPPKNWIDAEEKKEGKKILHFALKTEMYQLVLSPLFENPLVDPPRNSSPELVTMMLKQGALITKLREVHKGKNVYRIINIPRAWVRTKEQERNRKIVALRVMTEPTRIIVEPVYAGKEKSFGNT